MFILILLQIIKTKREELNHLTNDSWIQVTKIVLQMFLPEFSILILGTPTIAS